MIRTVRDIVRLCALMAVAALVPACGGGGGGGEGGGGSPAPPPGGGGPGGVPLPGPDLIFTVPGQQTGALVRACVPAPDGSGDIYLGGEFRTYNNALAGGIVRLNANGTVDPAFASGAGVSSVNWNQPGDDSADVRSIVPAVDGSGDIYVAGEFGQYQGVVSPRIVRLNADGSVDPSFTSLFPAATGQPVRQMVSAGDGSGDLYLLHDALPYGGAPTGHVFRINADGTLDAAFATGAGFGNPGTPGPVFGIDTSPRPRRSG